jgi:L-methionine (R)-S-oxide reductase
MKNLIEPLFDKNGAFVYIEIEFFPETVIKMQKEETYKWVLKQVQAQLKRHTDTIATTANIVAILKYRFDNFFWVGFYFLKGNQLTLGPFQGPPACMTLTLEKGVCAAAVLQKKTILVPDVHLFPGHVACDPHSNSEIVIPCFNQEGMISAVIDIDSEKTDDFDQIDKKYLEILSERIKSIWKN